MTRVWNRFFKADEARNRDDGGSGIGLSIVRAIMNNYGNDFGVENKDNGVEFYFEVDLSEENSKWYLLFLPFYDKIQQEKNG